MFQMKMESKFVHEDGEGGRNPSSSCNANLEPHHQPAHSWQILMKSKKRGNYGQGERLKE